MNLNKIFKKQEEEKRKDFESRAKQFLEEYQGLVRKYRIGIRAALDFIDGGRGGIFPKNEAFDATDQVGQKEAELKVEEEKNKIETEDKT